jgi:hypothetical protein
MSAMDEHNPPSVYPRLLRALGPALVVSVLNRRLRRHLAPTKQVRVGRSRAHSP